MGPLKKKRSQAPDGMTVGFSASSEEPIMFGRGTGSGNLLAWSGSCVGRASHAGSLFTVKEALNLILHDHAI